MRAHASTPIVPAGAALGTRDRRGLSPAPAAPRLSRDEWHRLAQLRDSAIDLDVEADDLRAEIERASATTDPADLEAALARNRGLIATVQRDLQALIAKAGGRPQ